jgi:hypothetical protein
VSAVVKFNSTVRLTMPNYQNATLEETVEPLTTFHKRYVANSLKKIARQFVSNDLTLMDVPLPVLDKGAAGTEKGDWFYYTDVVYQGTYIVDYTAGYNHSNTDDFVALVVDKFEEAASVVLGAHDGQTNLTVSLRSQAVMSNPDIARSLEECTLALVPGYVRPSVAGVYPHIEYMELVTPNTDSDGNVGNPYAQFCNAGCAYFFSEKVTSDRPTSLSNCTAKCDHTYRSSAHITVGYSDLAQTARLECRDGCQIALKRCQPGYKCSQVAMSLDGSGNEVYTDGAMIICPPGTYRDVSYDQVEECVDCPPGRYREDEKGRYMESCSKCPVGKYVNKTGSANTLDCDRCPAGRFGPEPGLALCKCITEMSCEDPEEFPSPANAERRETFPFEGRW